MDAYVNQLQLIDLSAHVKAEWVNNRRTKCYIYSLGQSREKHCNNTTNNITVQAIQDLTYRK